VVAVQHALHCDALWGSPGLVGQPRVVALWGA
jgi:hypothetical protein